jgi:hypothetical protein
MEKYREIYNQFYNSDPNFKSDFQDINSFADYIGENENAIEDLKEVYSFNNIENQSVGTPTIQPIAPQPGDEIKKKEPSDANLAGGLSESQLISEEEPVPSSKKGIFSIFPKLKKEPKAVGSFLESPTDPFNFKNLSDQFEELEMQKANLTQVETVGETYGSLFNTATLNVANLPENIRKLGGYFGLNNSLTEDWSPKTEADLKIEELERQQEPLNMAMREIAQGHIYGKTNEFGEGLSNPLVTKRDRYVVDGKEVSIPTYNESLIKELSKPERAAATALGEKEVKYNLVVDEEKLETFTADSWDQFQKAYFPGGFKTWDEVKNTKTGEIYKNTVRDEIKQGIEAVQINEELDKVFLEEYGIEFDDLDKQIHRELSGLQSTIVQKSKFEAEDVSSKVLTQMTQQLQPLITDVETMTGGFKEKYERYYDVETGKYVLTTQEEVDAFNKDAEELSDYVADRNMAIQVVKLNHKDLLTNSLKQIDAKYGQEFDKAITSTLSQKYSEEKLKQLREKAVKNYTAKKLAEEKLAEEKIGYGDKLGLILNSSTNQFMAGLGQVLEQYGGGKGAFSTYFSNLGDYKNEYELNLLNPSVLKTKVLADGTVVDESLSDVIERISTYEGFTQFMGDVGAITTKNAIPGVVNIAGVALAGKAGVNRSLLAGVAVTNSFIHDSAMESTEIYDRVYKETGSIVKAQTAAREKLGTQISLLHTYLIDGAILFGKGRINNGLDVAKIGLAKYASDVASETILQESFQNYYNEKIAHEILTGTRFEKKLTDFIDLRTTLDVAAGSSITQGVGVTVDGVKQIKNEKIKNRTLELLNTKGLSSLVLSVNKQLGKNAALSMGYMMRMDGKLSKEEYGNYVTTINRLNEFDEVLTQKDITDERKVTAAGKMLQRNELGAQKETAETQEKKDMIDAEIKKLDQQISDLQNNTKEVKVSSIKDFKTGRVIYATDDETMLTELMKNPELAKNVVQGVAQGVFVMDTENEKLGKLVQHSVELNKKVQSFLQDRDKLEKEYAQKQARASKDRLAGKKNTPTDAELQAEYQKEINNLVAVHDAGKDFYPEAAAARENNASQERRNVSDVVEQVQQFTVPTSVGNRVSFDADESAILDLFIEENKENVIASNVLNNIKTQVATFKQSFPEGKIIYHTTNSSFTQAYNKLTGSNALSLTDDGFFAETENGEIHINLSDPSKFNKMNEDVVAHEIFHGVLLKAFGKKIYDENGKFVRWESDAQAISDMKTAIEGIVNRYGSKFSSSLATFLANRNYEKAEKAEEFLVQLGALLSRAGQNDELEQGFVARVLAAISQFVKDKTGVDIFAFYRKQKDAVQFFNYIGSQLKEGKALDETKFQSVQGGFMIPREVSAEALSQGNIETGTVIAVHKSSENLNPVLNQFTKRPGTARLAYNLPVKTLKDAVKEHNGAVMLIMSDNTGFFVNPETNEFVMGGYGYMAAKANKDAGIGFASVNLGTVATTMTNAAACNEGNPVLALIVLSSPTASLGNYYALRYTFGALPSLLSNTTQSDEFKNSMISVIKNKLEILDAFEKDANLIKARIEANKLGDISLVSELAETSRNNFDKNFLPFFNSVDFTNVNSVDNFIKNFVSSKFTFPQRQSIISTLLPSHADLSLNKTTPLAKKILADNGLTQIGFHNLYGEPYFVGDKLSLNGPNVQAPWGSVYGGFTINPKADPLKIQDKGLKHPQFNAKVPGYNHFLLDGEYGVNENFYDALSFGSAPIDRMATQGIQPGTRLPASNKNPNALTSKERREMLLERPMIKRSMEALSQERQAFDSMVEQFAKRLGVDHTFYFDQNDTRLYYRSGDGTINFNTAVLDMRTPIYAFSGIFLEIFQNENLKEYNNLAKELLRSNDKSYLEFQNDLLNELQNKALENFLTEVDQNTTGEFVNIFTGETYNFLNPDKSKVKTIEEFKASAAKFVRLNLNVEDIKNQKGLVSINSPEFREAFEKTLLRHFGKIVQNQYDLGTGIYTKLRVIWQSILNMIKDTLGMNRVYLADYELSSSLSMPLEGLANLFADPRNMFDRSKEFDRNVQRNIRLDAFNSESDYIENWLTQNQIFGTVPNEESTIINYGGDMFITTVPNFNGMSYAIENFETLESLKYLGFRSSTEPFYQQIVTKLTPALKAKIKSLEFFNGLGFSESVQIVQDKVDDARNTINEFAEEVSSIINSIESGINPNDTFQKEAIQTFAKSIDFAIKYTLNQLDFFEKFFNEFQDEYDRIDKLGANTDLSRPGFMLLLHNLFEKNIGFIDTDGFVSFNNNFESVLASETNFVLSLYHSNKLSEMAKNLSRISENSVYDTKKQLRSYFTYKSLTQMAAEDNFSSKPLEVIPTIDKGFSDLDNFLEKYELVNQLKTIQETTYFSDYASNWDLQGYFLSDEFINSPLTTEYLSPSLLNPATFTARTVNIKDLQNLFKGVAANASGKLDRFKANLNKSSREGNFKIVAKGDKTVTDSYNLNRVIKTFRDGEEIEMEVSTQLKESNGSYGVYISFKEARGSYSDMINWGGQITEMFGKIINTIMVMYQDIPVEFITFSPVGDTKETVKRDSNGKPVIDPQTGKSVMEDKNIRKNIYNLFTKRAFAPFIVTPLSSGTVIMLPKSKMYDPNVERILPKYEQMLLEDIDTINSTVKVKKSKAETLGRDSRQIDAEYERMVNEGKTPEQIFGNLFSRFSYESMRSSKYNAEFQSYYDDYVSNKAKETWSTYSANWNKRKQGIMDFVDKYILDNTLMQIVTVLREGVRFIDVNDELIAEGESQAMVVRDMGTPLNQDGEKVSFSDLEIYSALFEYGIPQTNLDKIFGTNYRKTIDNLLLDEDFDSEIKANLTEDARAQKIILSFPELTELSDQLGIMPSTAILNYINKHLSVEKGSPVLPAVKAIVDKINEAKNLTEVADEFGKQVELVGNENIQALAELGTAAGRILRILRELNKNKSEIIIDAIKESKIKITPAFEQEIRNAFRNLDKARNAFEQAKKAAIEDFTDFNVQELNRLEDELIKAEYKVSMILSDPRLQFRFASEVLTNRGSLSLLGFQTAVLSRVANIESLLAKYGLSWNLLKRLSENIANLIKPDILSKSKGKVFRGGFEEFRNRRLAFSTTLARSRRQVVNSLLDGAVPNTAQAKFYENIAKVNSFDDVKNLAKLIVAYKKKNNLTDLDFADIMQVMLVEHKENGKLIVADNKAYSVLGAMFRAMMQPQEITGRLMALGMDRYAANIVSKKALLDYITMRSAMENSELPTGLIDELIRRGTMTNNAQEATPFAQDPKKPVYYLPGGNPETEIKNLSILMSAIFRDSAENGFDAEGMRSTFYADNWFTNFVGSMKSKLRKGMIESYLNSLDGKTEKQNLKKWGYRGLNALIQSLNILQWTFFTFPKVPSNIILQILTRTNPIGALPNSVYTFFIYNKKLNDFYKKYKLDAYANQENSTASSAPVEANSPMLPSQKALPFTSTTAVATTTNEIDTFSVEEIDSPKTKDKIRQAKRKLSTKEKVDFEKDLGEVFAAKRRYVTAISDILRGTEFVVVVGAIAASGAVMSSGEPPEKKRLMKQLGVVPGDFNITYFKDYLIAKYKNPKLTPEEFYTKRGGFNFNSSVPQKDLPQGWKIKDGKVYDNSNKEVKTDVYVNITNLGTYFGYGLGYMSSVYALEKEVGSESNSATEGFKNYIDLTSLGGSILSSIYKQTPSLKQIQDFLDSAEEDARKQGQGSQVSANILATTASIFAPSLLGKPRSQASGETVQSAFEIEEAREDFSLGKSFLDAHIKLSRNGLLGLGLAQSEFYKSQIGLFGEDLGMRRTISEPKSFLSYLEATLNFPSMKLGTEVKPAADEFIKQAKAREFLINTSYLATVYGNMGGDANRYWSILDRPRKNAFVLTDTKEVPLTGEDLDKKFKLPNDIYRDELRILGEKMLEAAESYATPYKLENVKSLVMATNNIEERKILIEEYFSGLNEEFLRVEAEYKTDFIANRASGILRTMQDRGLLTEADMEVIKKLYEQTELENVLSKPEQLRWSPTFDKKK